MPTQNIQKGLERTTVEIINNDFYDSFNSYPYVNVSISEPMVMRDVVLCNINVVPFNYSPKQEILEIYESISINIREVGETEDVADEESIEGMISEEATLASSPDEGG